MKTAAIHVDRCRFGLEPMLSRRCNMKPIRLNSLVLMLIGVLTSSCTSASHPVATSVEGIYDFYFDEQFLGHLELSGGHYSFTLSQDNIQFPEGAIVSNEFFVRHPQGLYNVEYYGSVKPDTSLEDLAEYAILLLIRLDVKPNNESVHDPLVEDLFVITKKDHWLYFGSAIGHIQMWRIEKAWQ